MSWTTAQACQELPNLTPDLIYSWRKRDRLRSVGRFGREALWDPKQLIALEKQINARRAGQDRRCRVNVPISVRGSVPELHLVSGVKMPPETRLEPLTETQITTQLPNGQYLRIDVAVMPDLEVVSHAEVIETLRAS